MAVLLDAVDRNADVEIKVVMRMDVVVEQETTPPATVHPSHEQRKAVVVVRVSF